MISIVKIGNLEIKKSASGDGFRAYTVFDGDDVLLSNAHFKEAIDFVNRFSKQGEEEVREKDFTHKLPPGIEAVFLYDRGTAQIAASLTRAEAESVFKEEINCIPEIGSILMMSPENSDRLDENIVEAVEVIGAKTIIIFFRGT